MIAVAENGVRKTGPTKVWTTLITNTAYLTGLLTLEHSLRKSGSKYPLVAFYTDTFPAEGHKALDARRIMKQRVEYLVPSTPKEYTNDPRFYDCWPKLTPFSLVEYERVVQLDSDMLVLQNMDELMELELDAPELNGNGDRVFAASHACVCNPLKKPHYPVDWIQANCAFFSQHENPDAVQEIGAPPTTGLSIPNVAQLATSVTSSYEFADQSLLRDMFHGRWVALPYIYNALKSLRWEGVHDAIWRDNKVKNVHYILSPKPWDEVREGLQKSQDPSHVWWIKMNEERIKDEELRGKKDEF